MAAVSVDGRIIDVASPQKLSDVLARRGLLALPCAGNGLCGKCRVYAAGELSAVTERERALLSQNELREGMRLACCATVKGDARVSVPRGEPRVLADGPAAHYEHKPKFSNYGAAVDIGTTTLALRLFGQSGLMSQTTALNPQSAYGADVISRVEKSLSGRGGELASAVREAVSLCLCRMCEDGGAAVTDIDYIVICGNTVMQYLLTGKNPARLAAAPFEADELFGMTVPADALELPCPKASVLLPRCISAFIGADITASVLASGMCESGETSLLVDVGTNGEVALWHEGVLYCCGTAAGPAFESGGLSCGMPAQDGAIDHARLQNGTLAPGVIGGGCARGVCGSGIIDILACLLENGDLSGAGALASGSVSVADGVVVTQKDIRMIQLAKSAVCAGIETLTDAVGVTPSQICSFYVAGGFGSYIDIDNAARIGLFPCELADKAVVLGNAALTGASMLLNGDFESLSKKIAVSAKTVDLSSSELFKKRYIDGMLFN